MGEGTHTATATAKSVSKQKLMLILGGTGVAILGATLLFQVLREGPSNEGMAAEDGSAGTARVGGEERYLGRVNGQLITWDEVAQECMDRYGREVLENVINRTIIQQACADRSITVSQAEVDQEIVRIAKRFGLDVDAWYNLLQAERGLSRVQYQRDVIWPMLALKKLAGEQVDVTDEDLRRAYVNNYGEMVKAKMIMMDHPRRIVEVWEKARKNPEEFERLAREYSIETNSAALGGAIPPIRRYSSQQRLSDAAFKLKDSEISGIIQLGDGLDRYVILKCEGRTEPVAHDPEDVRARLHADLVEEKVQESIARTFEKLKKASHVDNYITRTATRPMQQISSTAETKSDFEKAFPQATVTQ